MSILQKFVKNMDDIEYLENLQRKSFKSIKYFFRDIEKSREKK